jgi:hypothetical protein
VEPSEEIRHVVIRFFEALRDGDEEAVSNRISRKPGFQRFGTDAVEWWQDGDAAARAWIQVMRSPRRDAPRRARRRSRPPWREPSATRVRRSGFG